jgi:uncharacterized membrane protein
MILALSFGFLAAFLWGATDFLIGVAGRGLGIHRSILYAQATGALSIGLWVACRPSIWQPFHQASAWPCIAAALAAIVGLVATLALYQGMKVGRVGVVAPIAGAYGAVTAVLSWLTGERLALSALVGIGIIILGALLVSIPARKPSIAPASQREGTGLGWAMMSGLGFGLEFWIQGRFASPWLGAVLPVGIYYWISTSVLTIATLLLRPTLQLSWPDARMVVTTGLIAVLGFLALSAGLETGHIALVTALSSLQSAVTVGLACIFTGEQLAKHQWVGVVAIVIGLTVVRAP